MEAPADADIMLQLSVHNAVSAFYQQQTRRLETEDTQEREGENRNQLTLRVTHGVRRGERREETNYINLFCSVLGPRQDTA